MKLALKVKLAVAKSDESRIFQTFTAWAFAWQKVAEWSSSNGRSHSQMLAHQATYREIRTAFPDLPANLVQSARTDALAKIKAAKNSVKTPKLKKKILRFDTRTCTVKGNKVTFAMCGGKRINASFIEYPKFTEYRSKYKLLSPVVTYSRGVFWAIFVFDVPEPKMTAQTVIGFDFGQRNFIATSNGTLYKNKELNRLRRKTRFLKRALQKRGTKNARRKLRALRFTERRQSDNAIHCLTKQVLESTKENYIAVEALKLPTAKGYGKKGKNRRKYAVPIGKCIAYLSYKAPMYGKEVVKVNPYMTSQDDCRGFERGTRDKGRYIGVDGKILNADINAACNIAWKAARVYALNNPIVPCGYERQAPVTEPIACKSSGYALHNSGSCNSQAS